jgi:hypothetical protein
MDNLFLKGVGTTNNGGITWRITINSVPVRNCIYLKYVRGFVVRISERLEDGSKK